MNKQTKNITILTSCAVMLLGLIGVPHTAGADEITVSGNGSSANTSVNVTSSQQTTTQQSNTSQVANNTSTNASTGNNNASGNSGNASVNTGNANASTTVNTTANASSATQNCCSTQSSSVTVSGNGENTTNSVDAANSTNTLVSVNQNASITNNAAQDADTGNNSANGNNGNVTIKTGDIKGVMAVNNGPVNVANVSVPAGGNDDYEVKIAGNGEGSVNTILTNTNAVTEVSINNSAAVINNLKASYITGFNSANSNNGNVNILTGNILGSININNAPINVSSVTVTCCQKEHQKPTPPPAPMPQPTSSSAPSSSPSSSAGSSSSGGGSSSSGPGSVLGASTSSLPVTGNNWFFIALIGNILMMLLGGYLRLRSGRSPGFAVAH